MSHSSLLRIVRHALVLIPFLTSAVLADCPSSEEIDKAVSRGVEYLYSQQVNGIWDPPSAAGAQPAMTNTALVMDAITTTGTSIMVSNLRAPEIFLETHTPQDIPSAAWRAENWQFIPPRGIQVPKGRDELMNAAANPGARPTGLFGPNINDPNFDIVSTYHGINGLTSLERAGLEIPTRVWIDADKAIRAQQLPNGGWSPGINGNKNVPPTFVSTAAGFLALQMADDSPVLSHFDDCHGNIIDAKRDAALQWLDNDLKNPNFNVGPCEAAYWIERVGESAGRKYLGGKDWFSDLADSLIKSQKPDGSWGGDVRETAYALLFLRRGNTPILLNKLVYPPGNGESAWNERPADLSHFIDWTRRTVLCGTTGGWQYVDLDAPVDDFLEARILLICGNSELQFNDQQVSKLRDYVNRGGMILGNADCASARFSASFTSLANRMFPKYEMRQLPGNHPIFTDQMFRASKWNPKPDVRGMSNGVRELMILLPSDDISRHWQTKNYRTHEPAFQLPANLFLYACGKTEIWRSKANIRHGTGSPLPATASAIHVARLNVGDNWDPEPAAWQRMGEVAARDLKMSLVVETIKPGDGKMKAFSLAHLTGTTAFTLTPDARDEIKAFVDNGGTLLIDAAGGSTEFATAAENELQMIFGKDADELAVPIGYSKILFSATDGMKPIEKVRYHPAAYAVLTGSSRGSRLRVIHRSARLAVFFSHEDLTAGMAGVNTDIVGYDVPTATAIVSDILAYVRPK